MLENKDEEIKLFGWTIQICSKSEEGTMIGSKFEASASTDVSCECTSFDQNLLCSKQSMNQGCLTVEPMDTNQEDVSSTSSSSEESKISSSIIAKNPKAYSNKQDSSTQDLVQRKNSKDQTSTNTDQPDLKKPEEILPCPRCNSMNTKFCYFNNYNVNQPRHFCKNCQRYWTAGGCMRNVAVGSGRRKSKTSQPDSPNGPNYWPMRPNSIDLTSPNGLIRPQMGNPMENSQGFVPPQVACYPTYGWTPMGLPFYSPSCPPPQWVCHFVPNPSICPNPNPNYANLGKHSRDGTLLKPSNNNEEPVKEKKPENSTLRIVDDPIKVSKSSVSGSFGVEKGKAATSDNGGGFFMGLDLNLHKGVNPSYAIGEGSHLATQANPAAFCRSLSFYEVGEQDC